MYIILALFQVLSTLQAVQIFPRSGPGLRVYMHEVVLHGSQADYEAFGKFFCAEWPL